MSNSFADKGEEAGHGPLAIVRLDSVDVLSAGVVRRMSSIVSRTSAQGVHH